MRFYYQFQKLITLRDSNSITQDEFDIQKKNLFDLKYDIGLFGPKNDQNLEKRKLLKKFNDGDFFRIEEINIHFKPKNLSSLILDFLTEEDKLDFLNSRRLDNINNNKPINSGLPNSAEENETIRKFLEIGESREIIIDYFQRSESVLTRVITEILQGKLEDDDPYVIAAKKILDQTDKHNQEN